MTENRSMLLDEKAQLQWQKKGTCDFSALKKKVERRERWQGKEKRKWFLWNQNKGKMKVG